MKVNVHIERLVLEAMPITSFQGPIVQAAVASELARLLAKKGLTGISGGAMPSVSAGAIQLLTETTPAHLGLQIAQTLFTSLNPYERNQTQTGSPRGDF